MNDSQFQFVTIDELSRITGASNRTIRDYFNAGLIPTPLHVLHRRAWPFEMRDELVALIQRNYRGAPRRRRAASAAGGAA